MSLVDNQIRRCQRCDRETDHIIESVTEDNRPILVCWECVERHEKRFNTKPGWRRKQRSRRYEPLKTSTG